MGSVHSLDWTTGAHHLSKVHSYELQERSSSAEITSPVLLLNGSSTLSVAVAPRKRKRKEALQTRIPMDKVQNTPPPSSFPPPPISPPNYAYPNFASSSPSKYFCYQSPPFKVPYQLTFIKGNISICFGCRIRYPKSPLPPRDLCIKHQEWREFLPKGAQTPKRQFSNVYYHCLPQCIRLRNPDFLPNELDITAVEDELQPEHKSHLVNCFGLKFLS